MFGAVGMEQRCDVSDGGFGGREERLKAWGECAGETARDSGGALDGWTVESDGETWLVAKGETVVPRGVPVRVEGLGELKGGFGVGDVENATGGQDDDGNLEHEDEEGGECGGECSCGGW